jgi:hypothetical protein
LRNLRELCTSSYGPKAVAKARTASGAARLLKRLLDVGLSKYEPDPLAALEQAEQRQAAK